MRDLQMNGAIDDHLAPRRPSLCSDYSSTVRARTEAIPHAYEKHGAGCVPLLEGMFAFAAAPTRSHDRLERPAAGCALEAAEERS
jgi:asparagine synthetase B (glutamine-hydrolysing)